MSAGFGDIAPAVEVVDIRGTEIAMQGLPTEDIFHVWKRFRDAGKALGDGADLFEVASKFPDAMAALLAAGFGQKGNEDVEKKAARLSIGDQFKLLDGIIRATFAEGFGPFVKIMKAMGYENAETIIRPWIEPLSPSPSSTEAEQLLKPAA